MRSIHDQSSWRLRAACASVIILGLAMYPLLAHTQTSDGETPAAETVCDTAELDGAAWGLCNAYCEAMDCDSDDPKASNRACERVLGNWERHTDGMIIPCEEIECPCWSDADDLLAVHEIPGPISALSCSDGGLPFLNLQTFSGPSRVQSVVRVLSSGAALCLTAQLESRPGEIFRSAFPTIDEALECRDIILEVCP